MTTKEQNKLTMQKFLQFINTCDRKIAEDIPDIFSLLGQLGAFNK